MEPVIEIYVRWLNLSYDLKISPLYNSFKPLIWKLYLWVRFLHIWHILIAYGLLLQLKERSLKWNTLTYKPQTGKMKLPWITTKEVGVNENSYKLKINSGINTLVPDRFQARQLTTHSEMLKIASLFKDTGKFRYKTGLSKRR